MTTVNVTFTASQINIHNSCTLCCVNTKQTKIFLLSIKRQIQWFIAALKPGRVIQINQVTFSPGHPGPTRFTNYPGLTRIGSREILNCSLDDVKTYKRYSHSSFMSHAHLSHYKHTLSHVHLLVSVVCSTKLCPLLSASLRGAMPTNQLLYKLYIV